MKKCSITPVTLTYILLTIGVGTILLSLIISKGTFLTQIVYDFSYFVDFFDHIRRFYLGLDSVYAEGMHACFPPLAYLVYYLLARILYQDNIHNPDGLNQSGSGMLIVCMFTVFLSALFIYGVVRLYQGRSMLAKKGIALLLLFSYPSWLAIERGNMALVVLILLLFAVAFRDSEKRWERELALLLIAAAAGLKLYPAVFGVLYLTEKRYKEAVRLLVYGLFFFFAPFVFFQGVSGFRLFLRNITAVNSGATGVTIVGLTGRIGEKLGFDLAQGHAIGKGISYLYFFIVLLLCIWIGKSWKSIMLLASLMIVFVAASGSYCLIYSAVPFLVFLNEMSEKEKYRSMDYVYAVLFSLVFVGYPVKVLGSSGVLYISLYAVLALLVLEEGSKAIGWLYKKYVLKEMVGK